MKTTLSLGKRKRLFEITSTHHQTSSPQRSKYRSSHPCTIKTPVLPSHQSHPNFIRHHLQPRHTQPQILQTQHTNRRPHIRHIPRQRQNIIRQRRNRRNQVPSIRTHRQRLDERQIPRRDARRRLRQAREIRQVSQGPEFRRVDGGEQLQGAERGHAVLHDGQLEEEVGDDAVEHGEDVAGYGAEAFAAGDGDVFGDGADEEGEVGGDAWVVVRIMLGVGRERERKGEGRRTGNAAEREGTDADAGDTCG